MRITTILLVGLVLGGCTVQGRENDPPDLSVNTEKSPREYARCLGPLWLAMAPNTTSIETENGYKVVSSAEFYGVISLARIEKSDKGSTVFAYFPATKLGTDRWKEPVVSCL